jgi:hypothetical protein
MGSSETTIADAAFVRNVIRDNDHWNDQGIDESDIAVVFEMSARCDWGSDFTVTRLRQALALLKDDPHVTKRGSRWFTQTNARLDVMDETGARLCGRRGCGRDISHLKANAAYCSPGCRVRASRRSQTTDLP